MSFSNKVGSIQQLKKSLEKNTTSKTDDVWIKYIPRDGSLVVRFLTEPDEWASYNEGWDQTARGGKGTSYPVPVGTVVPDDQRVTGRYLASALDTESDRVIPIQIPKSLMQQVVIRYEKYGTLLDRDYELSRAGSGLDTRYMMDPEPPLARNLARYEPLNLETVLAGAYESYLSDNGIMDDATADIPVADIPVADIPVMDDEPAADEEELDPAELSILPIGALRALARERDISPRGLTKEELVAAISGSDAF